ncbi:unnamed protein product [Prunus armeniaca]|uniref:Uncharacterized protein n=1 Tax=Prunus armeniaca TaxID=36596 RepID=A0A6J5V5U4_PRUAR|nr:unnamed protein product [Prunus armeniaca]
MDRTNSIPLQGPNLWKPHHLKIDIQPEAQKLDSEDARIANYFDVIAGTSTAGPAYSLPQNLPQETVSDRRSNLTQELTCPTIQLSKVLSMTVFPDFRDVGWIAIVATNSL